MKSDTSVADGTVTDGSRDDRLCSTTPGYLEPMLEHEPAGEDQGEAHPCRRENGLTEDEPPEEDAHDGEEADVGPEGTR